MSRRKSKTIAKNDTAPRLRWLPGLMALLLVLAGAASGVFAPLERMVYVLTLHHFAPPPASGKVAVVELPQQWSEAGLAQALARLEPARAVAFLPLLRPTENRAALELVAQQLEALPEPSAGEAQHGEPRTTLLALQHRLDLSARLAERLQSNANVLLARRYLPEDGGLLLPHRADGPLFGDTFTLSRYLPSVLAPFPPRARTVEEPGEVLRGAASASGMFTATPGDNSYPALVQHDGRDGAGLLLQLLQQYHGAMGLVPEFDAAVGVRLGALSLPTDQAFRFRPYADPLGQRHERIARLDYDGLAAGGLEGGGVRDKTVIIGGPDEAYPLAHAVDAMLRQQVVSVPGWAAWGQLGAWLLVALLLLLLLPRLRSSTAGMITLLVLLLMLNGEFLLLLLGQQWLPLGLPALALLLGFPLITLRAYQSGREERVALELSDTNRQLGRLLQLQGELDQALERYRRCRIDAALLEQLYHLGLDFERKRQFAKAVSTFESIREAAPDYRDVVERISRNRTMEQRVALAGGGNATPGGTVIMDASGLQNPTLGHYEVEREIGRGAMGMVYLGKDPRIGRRVAIKTMALSAEFEGEQLEEVRQRFYREAETAGRLNHPNIVHVYDIGEEQELAYIAMDYLPGEHLGNFAKAAQLLPLNEVLEVVLQVARALDYAHQKNVVHRDIKPANIIYDRETKSAKVTDFGVACLTDSSKTRTGTVLGSPSYMSPEQVAGKKVDGRTDIFSLGVTLYQMVTGHLPFEADSLGSLMYKITNEQHPKPAKYRKGIPTCVTRIINKSMQKDPAKRYQSGAELAAALERCKK